MSTSMEVRELTAGRELDALVAEQVMGTQDIITVSVLDHRGFHSEPGTKSLPFKMPDGRMGVEAKELPHYSTDIAAAWEVVEKVGDMSVHRFYDQPAKGWFYHVSWRDSDDIGHHCSKEAETAPLAICLASLQSVRASLKAVEK